MQVVSRDAGHAHPLNWKLRQPNRPRTSACRRQLRLALSPHAATPTQPLWCRAHCQRTAVRQNHGFGVSVGLCTQCE